MNNNEKAIKASHNWAITSTVRDIEACTISGLTIILAGTQNSLPDEDKTVIEQKVKTAIMERFNCSEELGQKTACILLIGAMLQLVTGKPTTNFVDSVIQSFIEADLKPTLLNELCMVAKPG